MIFSKSHNKNYADPLYAQLHGAPPITYVNKETFLYFQKYGEWTGEDGRIYYYGSEIKPFPPLPR